MVALSGLLAFLITGEAPLWLVVPVFALAAFGCMFPARAARLNLSKIASDIIVIAALGFSVLDFFYVGGSLVTAGADFLVCLVAVKLLTLQADDDHVQLYTVSFFLMLASTGISTSMYFLGAFLLFFISLAWALTLRTIRAGQGAGLSHAARFKAGKGFFLGSAGLTLVSLLLTSLFFLMIPRVGIGYFSRKGGLLKTSGFSDRVELGSMGEVLLDQRTVMRVEIAGMTAAPDKPLLWRGRVFDKYNGVSWEDSFKGSLELIVNTFGRFYLRPGEKRLGKPVEQNITLEPLDTPTLFALYPAYQVDMELRTILKDKSDTYQITYPPGSRLHYSVVSAPATHSIKEMKAAGNIYSGSAWPGYLQLPEGSDRLKGLAAEVTAGAPSAYEKAERIQGYLARSCKYTLSPSRDQSLSPIDDFLFKSKEGYCEHFATATALMLRASGVPTRLVSGFAGGEWNNYGKFLLVRQKDAHTWVEAFLPRYGWVEFDPTPDSGPSGRSEAVAGLRRMLEYLSFQWDRRVVFFSLWDQFKMLHDIKSATARARQELGNFGSGLDGRLNLPRTANWKPLAAGLGFAAALLLAYRLTRRKVVRRNSRRAAVKFYEEMAQTLKRKGYIRPPGATPLEFAHSLPAGPGLHSPGRDVIFITELYNSVRFGGAVIGPKELEDLHKAIARLKKMEPER
jgi:protein-glutamine gamma-glutamyltransferase